MLVLTSFFSVPAILQGVNNNSLLIALNWAVIADICAATSVGSIMWFFSLGQRVRFGEIWNNFDDQKRLTVENMVSPHNLPVVHSLVDPAVGGSWLVGAKRRRRVRPLTVELITLPPSCSSQFSCCGYLNGTTAGAFFPHDAAASSVTPFCADPVFAANQTGCVSFITKFTDPTLELTFSYVTLWPILPSRARRADSRGIVCRDRSIYGFVIILAMFALATVCLINEVRPTFSLWTPPQRRS